MAKEKGTGKSTPSLTTPSPQAKVQDAPISSAQRILALSRKISGIKNPLGNPVRNWTPTPMEYAQILFDRGQELPEPEFVPFGSGMRLSDVCIAAYDEFFSRFGITVPLHSPKEGDLLVSFNTYRVVVHCFLWDCLADPKGPEAYKWISREAQWGPAYAPYIAAVLERKADATVAAAKAFGVDQGVRPGHCLHTYIEGDVTPVSQASEPQGAGPKKTPAPPKSKAPRLALVTGTIVPAAATPEPPANGKKPRAKKVAEPRAPAEAKKPRTKKAAPTKPALKVIRGGAA